MKPSIPRIALTLILSVLALFLAPTIGLAALALPLFGLLNYEPLQTPLLGTSYPVLNITTKTNLTDITSKVQEEMWVRRGIQGADYLYQDYPLADGVMMGRMVSGEKIDDRMLRRVVLMMTETKMVRGNTINIPTTAGFGGEGTQGEGTLSGTGQKIVPGNISLKTGRWHVCVGYGDIAISETVIGTGTKDKLISDGLRALHAKRRNDDHLMRLRNVAGEEGTGDNNMLPSGVSSIATLTAANVVDTVLISDMGDYLPGLGALPMDTSTDSGGGYGDLFLFFAADKSLRSLKTEPAYLDWCKQAGIRGPENPVFRGGFEKVGGHGLMSWLHRDHANRGPIGSPLVPRAKLGYALTGANTGSIVHGLGLVCTTTADNTNADNTNTGDTGFGGLAPQPFKFFRNAPYTFHNGDTIAAVENITRYIKISNGDGTGSVYSYRVNNAKAIIILGRIAVSGLTSYTHAKGALIQECNVLGIPFARSMMFGAQALVCGLGPMGENAEYGAEMGRRTEEHTNHNRDHEIGLEASWGNQVVSRAGDGLYPNFVMATHAIA